MWRQLGTAAVGWNLASISGAGMAQFGGEGPGYRGEDVRLRRFGSGKLGVRRGVCALQNLKRGATVSKS